MWIKKMDVIECKLWKFPSQTRAERGCGYVSKGKDVFACLPTWFGKCLLQNSSEGF